MDDEIARARARQNGAKYTGVPPEPNRSDEPRKPWTFTCPTSLVGRDPPEREWVVDRWLPRGVVTILYGDGGTGKTLLEQELMTSCATGHSWCGLAVERCRSLALFCEDDEDELHRRQHAINLAYDAFHEDLADMTWVSGVGHDNTLCEFDLDGRPMLTKPFLTLKAKALEIGAGLIVIDTAADTFAGNENDRRQVRGFIGYALGRLAQETGAAVLLSAHPSRTGMSATGDLDGGSTAWSNTARSRWSLTRPKAEGDEQGDADARVLTRRKANYASVGDTIKLRWQNGVLVPVEAPGGFSAMAAHHDAETVFLALLARTAAEGRDMSESRNAGNYAPRVFSMRPDRHSFTKRDFEAAMQRMFAGGRIVVEDAGRPGKLTRRLAIVPATVHELDS